MDKTADMLDLLFRAFTTHQDAFKGGWFCAFDLLDYMCIYKYICVCV